MCGGGGRYEVLDLRRRKVPLQVNFFRWRHFGLVSIQLVSPWTPSYWVFDSWCRLIKYSPFCPKRWNITVVLSDWDDLSVQHFKDIVAFMINTIAHHTMKSVMLGGIIETLRWQFVPNMPHVTENLNNYLCPPPPGVRHMPPTELLTTRLFCRRVSRRGVNEIRNSRWNWFWQVVRQWLFLSACYKFFYNPWNIFILSILYFYFILLFYTW